MSNNITNYGIVYVLTNPAMPDLVKIGMTNKESVDARMKELFNTSVPVPFECEYACRVTNHAKVEKALHIAFQPYKIHAQREFFSIKPEQAIAILKLLDKSSDITKEISEEINNDLSPMDKAAGAKLKITRRPPLNFKEMGIENGSKLVYTRDNSVEVEVCGEKKILFKGAGKSLTAATQELLGLDYSVQPTPYWTYKGKNLQDIYNETYTGSE